MVKTVVKEVKVVKSGQKCSRYVSLEGRECWTVYVVQCAAQSGPRDSLCAVAFTAIEADLEASVLAGWRLTTARAGLRKANELFKHSCPNDSCNEPSKLSQI